MYYISLLNSLVIVKCVWSGEQLTGEMVPIANSDAFHLKILWEVNGLPFWNNEWRKSQTYNIIGVIKLKSHANRTTNQRIGTPQISGTTGINNDG